MKALLSVYNKKEIELMGISLSEAGYEIISTGGTYNSLNKAGVPVQQISDSTGSPEILNGRVKTFLSANWPVNTGFVSTRTSTQGPRTTDHGAGKVGLEIT